MKKKIEYILMLILFALSLIYTNSATNIIKKEDPIMKSIMKNKNAYKIESVNAKIENDTITPGVNGCEVDINKSYQNMKKINEYTDKMLKYKDLIPEITISNVYNKYITNGNDTKREVSIIVNIDEKIDEVVTMANDNKIKINMFLDSEMLKNGPIKIEKTYIHIYNGGVNNNYDDITIEWMNDIIEDNYNESKYCINKNKNDNNLMICARNKMHTINPNLIVTHSNLYNIKSLITNGSIIYFDKNNINNIKSISNYILSKGYKIVFLDELLNEKACK